MLSYCHGKSCEKTDQVSNMIRVEWDQKHLRFCSFKCLDRYVESSRGTLFRGPADTLEPVQNDHGFHA